MALPEAIETPRGLELRAKSERAGKDLDKWPMLTRDDYVLVGGLVVLFSYVDFQMRRLVEALDHARLLPIEHHRKTAKLDLTSVEKLVAEAPVWTGPTDLEALNTVASLRRVRNLVAHFAIRRFPEDEAFFFVAKSAKDFRRVFGREPSLGEAITAVIERDRLVDIVKQVEHIHNWLAAVVVGFEKQVWPEET